MRCYRAHWYLERLEDLHRKIRNICHRRHIARLTCEFIENTEDSNREVARRCDFVVYRDDGGFWRLHPGGKGKHAQPVYFPPKDLAEQVLESTEPVARVAAELWRDNPPRP